eukprot:gene6071-12246_t
MSEFQNDVYVLKYFDIRGLAENTRVMFAISGTTFNDVRYGLNSPEFGEAKGSGDLTFNMDRAPILIYNGTAIGQARTIERFVAKKMGFFGADDIEAAHVDMIAEHIRDIKQFYSQAKAGKKDDELAEAKAKFMSEKFPEWMAKLEKCLGSSGFAVGNKMSLADVVINELIQDFFDDKAGATAAISACPKIAASVRLVAEAAKDYFANRPLSYLSIYVFSLFMDTTTYPRLPLCPLCQNIRQVIRLIINPKLFIEIFKINLQRFGLCCL